MEYESKKLTIEKIENCQNSVRIYFKEIGFVLLCKEYLDEKLLTTLKPGSSIFAVIEKAPVPCIVELNLLTRIYKK